MIETRNLARAYGETLVVDDISIRIPTRQVTAIVGPNGAGKSTLLSMIARLLPMTSGTVSVDGLDVSQTAGDVMAKRLAILRQDNHIGMRLTVRDLVAFGRYPHSKGRMTAEDWQHVDNAIAYLDMTDLSGRFLDQLSGGQRQRAFVAMVLCQDTDYLLLDEPLNNLDMKHAVAMMKLVRRAAHELGKTVVVVLHDINFASCYADNIIALRNGRLERQGPPSEIITTEALKAVYGMDIPIEMINGQRIAVYFSG